jgi:hypothetical protein
MCPCDPGEDNEIRKYWEGLGAEKLKEFGRVIDYDDLTEI